MNILVTGGAGYIGSHVVKLLGDTTLHQITVIDDLRTGFKESLLYGELLQIDLADKNKMEEVFKTHHFDAVIHFAASLIVPESVKDPLKYYLNNTANTSNLISLCIKYGVNRFIFSSTAAVYGEPSIDKIPVTENSPLLPINPYGWSKLMSERILMDTSLAHPQFKYGILRYFNVAGASVTGKIGQRTQGATHLIKVAAEAALGKRSHIGIFGTDFPTYDGTGVRDYIHVDDLAMAHLQMLEYLANNQSTIVNCGYGRGFSVKDVIDTMKKVSHVDFKVVTEPRREGDPAALVSDNSKISQLLQWTPRYNDLELICQTAFEWEKQL